VASTNAFEPLRVERRLPITVVFYAHVHPGYYEGDNRIGEAAWRLCYTDGGALSPSPVRERLLDEAIRLAEAMHGFMAYFGDMPLWNTLASGGVLPYISSYPCVTTLMRWGDGRSVAPETASMKEGARFHLNTSHHRPDPLVTGCHAPAP
jgi:hypothetical protein